MLGVCGTTCVHLLLRLGTRAGAASAAQLSLVLGLLVFWVALRLLPRRPVRAPAAFAEQLALVAAALFTWRAFGWLVFTDPTALRVLSPNNLGDLSLHLSLIRYLSTDVPFWPESPILARAPLRYPIGADLFNAILLAAGLDAVRGLVLTGFVGAIAVFGALWRWARGFGIAAFLFAGGLAGFEILAGHGFRDYQDGVAWKSLPLASLVTQRGLLYAIPAGLLLLDSWRARLRGGNRKPLPFWAEWILLGTLPLFHAHSLLCLGALLAGCMAFGAGPVRAHAMKLALASLPPAVALTHLITGGFSTGGTVAFHPGWMQGDAYVFWFWLLNFGVVPFLLAILAARLVRRDPAAREARCFVLPALGLIALAVFFRLAPWEWDNVKVFLWAYLAVLPALYALVLQPLPLRFRVPVLAPLFFSGAVSLVGGLGPQHRGNEIAPRAELDAAALALGSLPPHSRIAAAQDYNHPVLLNGWPVAAGYAGHLWSHGYPNHKTVEENLRTLLSGAEGWEEAARRLGTPYLCWSRKEASAYPDSRKPWENRLRIAAEAPGFRFYDLTPVLDPSDRPLAAAAQPAAAIAQPIRSERSADPPETF